MAEIQYLIGDATRPSASGNKLIVHVCNDLGRWGKGFVVAVSARWPEPEAEYRKWFGEQNGFELGAVQFVQVESDLSVANLIGQEGIREKGGVPPIRYESVRIGMKQVAAKAKELAASVHMPRIGCGLAGGKWSEIEAIIAETLCKEGVDVTVYDLGG